MRIALGLGAAAVVAVVWLGLHIRREPARCAPGYAPHGGRCCASSQQGRVNACTGLRKDCLGSTATGGCQPAPKRVVIEPAQLDLRFDDWQSEGVVPERQLRVNRFEIDNVEVTWNAYGACTRDAACEPLRPMAAEGDLPVVNLSPGQARKYCNWRGGRLPTRDEWTVAAAGGDGFKYPWGHTGLVCRRAVYGLAAGPCAWQGTGPDAVGTRPAGQTPTGIFDLAGNVAEWVSDGARHVAMGGSFRSQLASELKVWSAEVPLGPSEHVGFRCVYPAGAG